MSFYHKFPIYSMLVKGRSGFEPHTIMVDLQVLYTHLRESFATCLRVARFAVLPTVIRFSDHNLPMHYFSTQPVRVTGIEPATSCIPYKHSRQTELHPEIVYRQAFLPRLVGTHCRQRPYRQRAVWVSNPPPSV